MALFEKIFQRNDKFYIQFYFVILGISLYLCSLLSYYIGQGTFKLPEIYTTAAISIVIIFWISGLVRFKEYRYIIGTVQFLRHEFIVLIQTFSICILLAALFKITGNYSRIWFVTTVILSFIILILLKVFFDIIYTSLITSNTIQRNILLVGDSLNCQNIIKKFPKKRSNSVIKCLITTDNIVEKDTNYYFGLPRFNLNDDFNYIFNHHSIGQVWIVSSIKTQTHIESLVDKFLNFSIDCRLISPESKFKFTVGLDNEAGFDFYNISFSPFYGTNLLIKHLLDKLLSVFFIILSLPILLIASMFILLEDGFPVIYKQKRKGWDGKQFTMFKFRSMKKEKKLTDKSERKTKGPSMVPVVKGDKRLLGVGGILRRFSIDELPQFFNVLIGDMSIVGPRPHANPITEYYSKDILNFMQRHKCPPGLTGWAQVNGLRGTSQQEDIMDKRFQYDLYYIKNWSLVFDVYIMLRTFFVVLFSKVD